MHPTTYWSEILPLRTAKSLSWAGRADADQCGRQGHCGDGVWLRASWDLLPEAVVGPLAMHAHLRQLHPLSDYLKNNPTIKKINSNWIKDLNAEENIGRTVFDVNHSNIFLDSSLKTGNKSKNKQMGPN